MRLAANQQTLMTKSSTESSALIARKSFLFRLLCIWASTLILPVLYVIARYIMPPQLREKILDVMMLGQVSDIPADGAKIVKFNKTPVILVKNTQGQIKAFSAVCTHLGCIVEFRNDDSRFHCNCHGSVFDRDGKNIGGPAPRPLQPYRVELKGESIMVSKS